MSVTQNRVEWLGTPCTSDWWIFTEDVFSYFARRGVLSLVLVERLRAGQSEQSPADIGAYLRSADRLHRMLKTEEDNIAAEAVSLEIPWSVIGYVLGFKSERTGAQKAYGHVSKRGRPAVSCLDPNWCREQDADDWAPRHQIRLLSHVIEVTLPDRIDNPGQEWVGVLAWLSSARSLRTAMESTIHEIAAEMKSPGTTWKDIGAELGVGDTAVQKRFRKGLGEARLAELRHEAQAAVFLQDVAGWSAEEHDTERVSYQVALPYAANSLKKACETGIISEEDAVRLSFDDILDRVNKARDLIKIAAESLAEPGVFQDVMAIARAFDKVQKQSGLDIEAFFVPFVMYVYYLQLLSFECTFESYEVQNALRAGEHFGSADEFLERYMAPVGAGLRVAGKSLKIVDDLGLHVLYSARALDFLVEFIEEEARGGQPHYTLDEVLRRLKLSDPDADGRQDQD